MTPLRILAGPEARRQLAEHGWQPVLFDRFIAASGGPKWLPMAALDRTLMTRWIPAGQRMRLLGTSSGGWRCAALCHPEAAEAHRRLQHAYIDQRYERRPGEQEVRHNCVGIMRALVGESGFGALLSRPDRVLNLIACRWKGQRVRRPVAQALSLALTATLNLASRRLIQAQWERWLFSADHGGFSEAGELSTHHAELGPDNLEAVLLATGSIPLLSPGELDIPGARSGRYMDGGITDYHLDLPVLRQGGLVLYPHFHPYALPGWFDKPLKGRRAGANFDRVVMLVPSDDFVASLPGAKIPDRDDFKVLANDERIERWQAVVEAGEQLAHAFTAMVSGEVPLPIEPID
ncbi:alpha/beta hydrolase [Ferrimonas sediminicola]|uniref:Alpha/beta hydrolase n=1 Tax=Ferrimonas sediminicola TaxID=2569538 RepID=A0A4U1BKK5_9GAMM|nr:alpha/beta hydrolase [Ferrimonas sediminicola]TKB51344.1 alpha/beta hydrolase [Ferrimonas sediminicola]